MLKKFSKIKLFIVFELIVFLLYPFLSKSKNVFIKSLLDVAYNFNIITQLKNTFFSFSAGNGNAWGDAPLDEPNINQNNLSNVDHKNIADIQHQAMEGIGTDETILFDSLYGLTSDDLELVHHEFGKRRMPSQWQNKRSLSQWYASELNSAELAQMRDIWQDTIYRF